MIGALAMAILPLIPKLVAGVEQVFVTPKSGADKMSAAVAMLREAQNKLQATGQITSQVSDDELRGLIEAEVQRMKAAGTMQVPADQKMFLVVGKVQEVTFK